MAEFSHSAVAAAETGTGRLESSYEWFVIGAVVWANILQLVFGTATNYLEVYLGNYLGRI